MKKLLVIVAIVLSFAAGLFLEDRLFGVDLPRPIKEIVAPRDDSPYHQIRLQSLTASKSEGFIFLIEEETTDEYLVFPKIGTNGVMRIEVVRK